MESRSKADRLIQHARKGFKVFQDELYDPDGAKPMIPLDDLFYLFWHEDDDVAGLVVSYLADALEDKRIEPEERLRAFFLMGLARDKSRWYALDGLKFFETGNLLHMYAGLMLQDKDPWVRVTAVENLVGLRDRAAAPFFEEALNDKFDLVRVKAAEGLGLCRSAESEDKLFEKQKRSRQPLFRAACWGALLLITEDTMWFDKLVAVLDHEDYLVPTRMMDPLEEAIEAGIVPAEQVIAIVRERLQTESRPAVVEAMRRLIERHKG